MARIRTAALTAAVIAVAGATGCGGSDGAKRHDRVAAPKRFVASNGSDAGTCRRANPCASLGRALLAARPGEIVEVAAGDYPEQELRAERPSGGRLVVFQPARGATVRVAGVRIATSNVELRRLHVTGIQLEPTAHQVVLRDLEIAGGLFITSASRISVLGGSIGPGTDVSPQIKAASGSTTPPRDILIEGVAFHDFVREQPDAHVDCLHVMAAERLVLRGNSFANCEAFDVLFTKFGEAGSPRDILIENNTFSCCRSGFYSLFLSGGHGEQWRDVLVRNNSADKSFSVSPDAMAPGARVRFLSNVAPHVNPLLCGLPGVEWDYNVWAEGPPCGEHDSVAPSGFAAANHGDFRLREGAAAIGHGHPSSIPPVDAAGRRRPAGGEPDAGAFEY